MGFIFSLSLKKTPEGEFPLVYGLLYVDRIDTVKIFQNIEIVIFHPISSAVRDEVRHHVHIDRVRKNDVGKKSVCGFDDMV